MPSFPVWLACCAAVALPLAAIARENGPAESAPKAVPVDESAPKAVPVDEGAPKAAGEIPGGEPAATQPVTSVSRSGQFVVHGGRTVERGLVAVGAEDLKEDLLRLLGAEDKWKTPVVVELHGGNGGPRPRRTVVPDLYVTAGGFRLQLDINLARGLDHEQFEYAVLSMLIYEWSLRGRGGEIAGRRLIVRPWLVEGLREAIRWRTDKGDRRLYASLYETGGLFDLETMLATGSTEYEKFDATARAAFRGSAGSLVLALLEQPDGRSAFRGFLGEVAVFDGDPAILLRKHFPGLNLSKKSLAKWWALQMANMAEAPLTEVLSVPETDKALANALQFHVPDETGMTNAKDLSHASAVLDLPEGERAEAVRPAQDALVRLSYRCFPSFRPIIVDYQKILNEMVAGKVKKLEERLEELAGVRAQMVRNAADGASYLDWFMITRARSQSGEFSDYLRLMEQLRSKPDHHNDPLSLYLDRMQEAFER
jgi:hypothetical protein